MVGPLGRDETLAAIAQHDQQLQSAVSAKMAQYHQRLPLQRMPATRDRHGRGHRLITALAGVVAYPATWRRLQRPNRRPLRRGRSGRPADPPGSPRRCSRRSAGSAAHLPTRQHPGPQRLDRRHEIHRDQPLTGEHAPRPTQSDVTEVATPQPLSVTDQQLHSRLQTQQAARPRPQPSRKVLETGSKSGGPSTRSIILGCSMRSTGSPPGASSRAGCEPGWSSKAGSHRPRRARPRAV